MNTSGISKDIPRSELQVSGRASLSQLDLSGYSVPRLKVKLRGWRKMGIVDWTPRSDNKGNDYIVYATPNPDVTKKAEPDPKKQEQAQKAAAVRWNNGLPQPNPKPKRKPFELEDEEFDEWTPYCGRCHRESVNVYGKCTYPGCDWQGVPMEDAPQLRGFEVLDED